MPGHDGSKTCKFADESLGSVGPRRLTKYDEIAISSDAPRMTVERQRNAVGDILSQKEEI
jgi:hypothetical protein